MLKDKKNIYKSIALILIIILIISFIFFKIKRQINPRYPEKINFVSIGYEEEDEYKIFIEKDKKKIAKTMDLLTEYMTEKARNNKNFDLNEKIFKELNINNINYNNLNLLKINIVYDDGKVVSKQK